MRIIELNEINKISGGFGPFIDLDGIFTLVGIGLTTAFVLGVAYASAVSYLVNRQ